jgi:hypothetical protein
MSDQTTIREIAEDVYKTLVSGFSEDGYDRAMQVGLRLAKMKAISGELGASEEQQLRNYMTILKVQRGMLINFQQPGRKQGKNKLDIRELAL